MQITIPVKNKRAISPHEKIVCGNSDYTICFEFDVEWNEFETKTARFEYDGGFFERVFKGDICPVPVLQNTTACGVGVYAGNLRTTTKAMIGCERSILCGNGVQHEEPEPDVYQQLLEMLGQTVITDITIDESGHLIVTTENGDKYDAGYARGEKGEPGSAGGGAADTEPYELPVASADTLGGVRIGEGLRMDGDVLNVQDKVYTHIETFTFGEDMAFERTQEPSGRAYAFDAIALQINKPAGVTIGKAISISVIFTGSRIAQPLYFVPCSKTEDLWMLATVENYKGLVRRTRTTDWAIYNSTSAVNEVPFLMFDNVLRKGDAIVRISTSQIIPAGITFEIWGVRANA